MLPYPSTRFVHSIQAVFFSSGKDDLRFEIECFFPLHPGESHDDDFVTGLKKTRCGAVETDAAGTALTLNDVGFNASPVHVVHHVNVLSGNQTGCFHEVGSDGDASHVVKIRLRHMGTMYFGFKNAELHKRCL